MVGGTGIFTSITGNPPMRIFNIEWRTSYFTGSGAANYELRLYEGQSRFDVIYGAVDQGNASATAGVQKNDTAFDQYFCNGSGQPATGGQSYILNALRNTNANAYGYSHSDGNSHCNGNSDGNSDGNSYCNSHGNGYGHGDSNCYRAAEATPTPRPRPTPPPRP